MKKRIQAVADFFATKQMLYTMCFIAFNVIDFLRDTQNGDVWSVVVNLTGLVMLVVIGSAYSIQEFRTPFTYLWSLGCLMVMVGLLLMRQVRVYNIYIWTWETAMLNVWWIGIFVWHWFRKIRKETPTFSLWWREFKWFITLDNPLGWLWVMLTICMMISRNGRVWPVWFLLMFGIFFKTSYQKEDRQALLEGMINGTIISFLCIQIYAYGFRPYDIVRYKGAYTNPNIAALQYLIVFTMILLKLHTLEVRGAGKFKKIAYLMAAGKLLGFQFMTMGRTAWISSVLLTVLFGVLVVRKLWKRSWKGLLLWWSMLILSMVITFPIVFGSARWLPTILHHPVWYESEGYSIDWVHSYDGPDSEKYVEWDEFFDAALGRILKTLGIVEFKHPLVLQVQAAETSRTIAKVGTSQMDESLRIRLSIYKAYIEDLNFTGHSVKEGFYKLEDTDYTSWHAQNLWLQITYYFGIPAGFLFLLLTVWLIAKNFKKIQAFPEDPYSIVPFFICVAFFAYGIMEVVWNPGQLILLLFFFVQHPGTPTKKEPTSLPHKI